jgi:hypothetical protein
MKKSTIFQISFVLLVLVLIVASGNAKALDQPEVYLPITFRKFCLDIFDDFSSPSSGWYTSENEYQSWGYLEGEYRILITDALGDTYRTGPHTCPRENYTVEVDARWVGEPGNSYGILFGTSFWIRDGYLFLVDTDETPSYTLERMVRHVRYEIFTSPSTDINSGNESNHLKVTRLGNEITLEINGIILGTWTDASTGPKYALIIAAPKTEHSAFDVRFDNFSITTLTQNPLLSGSVEIQDIFQFGTGSSEPDEYVEIRNDDSSPIQLNNWTLEDEEHHVFKFPPFVIQPNQTCRIYTNEYHPEWCGFRYESGSAIWNNGGDTATLRDANGTLIDDYSY